MWHSSVVWDIFGVPGNGQNKIREEVQMRTIEREQLPVCIQKQNLYSCGKGQEERQ
jgi:hypothetical protein